MPVRILIADDNQLVRKTLQELLQTHGWEVCGEAEDGLDAVRKTLELKPDAVILDLAMPLMDGLAAARKISESLPAVPIVMHTLHAHPQLELEAKKNGVRFIVPKSASSQIISVLEELVSPRGSTGLSEPVATNESTTAQEIVVPAADGTVASIQAAAPKSQTDLPGDIAKAS